MNLITLQQQAGRLNPWLLALLAFTLPLSTSALSVLALLILLCWLIEGNYRKKIAAITASPVVMTVLVYLLLLIMGLLWTHDLNNGLAVLKKNWKLMLLPVFFTVAQASWRPSASVPGGIRFFLGFFVAGMTVAMTLTWLAWFDLFQTTGTTPAHLTRGTFHVIYNPLLALTIYLLAHEVLWGKAQGISRWALLGLAGLMTVNMFITEGRCGQLAFFVLLALLCLQIFHKNLLRALLITILGGPLLFTLAYQASPVFHERVNRGITEIQQFHQNPNTSVGLRLLFWQNSWELIANNPLIGVGTGDFPSDYAVINQKNSPNLVATDNPHNQFILAWSQLGLLGLVSLISIFVVQIWQGRAPTAGDGWQRARIAFPVFFLTIMLTESYFIIASTGFLFSFLSAILYAPPTKAETA